MALYTDASTATQANAGTTSTTVVLRFVSFFFTTEAVRALFIWDLRIT